MSKRVNNKKGSMAKRPRRSSQKCKVRGASSDPKLVANQLVASQPLINWPRMKDFMGGMIVKVKT